MRDGEGINGNVAHFERCSGAEQSKVEARLELQFHSFLGQPITVNRHGQLIAKGPQPIGMVGVLVGKEDSIEGFGGPADERQPFPDLFGAKPSIDQKTRIFRLDIRAITVRTTAKNRKLNRHERQIRKGPGRGQSFTGKFTEKYGAEQ
jgi:hypothetical protein